MRYTELILSKLNLVYLESKMSRGSLSFGVYPYPPFITVLNNKLSGILDDSYTNIHYFILRPFNVTFFVTSGDRFSLCSSNGKCNGHLGNLQSGVYDYGGLFEESQLLALPDNITLGPLIGATNCYTTSEPIVRSNLAISDVYSTLTAFDTRFIILMCASTGLLIILLSFLKPRYTVSRWCRIFFEYSLGQRYRCIPNLKQKFIFYFFLVSSILSGKLFSASLQTGLTSTLDFIQIDTVKDILDYNCKPTALGNSPCHKRLKSSVDPLLERLVEVVTVLDLEGESPFNLYSKIREHGDAIIGDSFMIVRIFAMWCSMAEEDKNKIKLYISRSPLYVEPSFVLVNSYLDNRVTRNIFKYALAAFEMSTLMNYEVLQQDGEELVGHELSPNCISPLKPAKEVIITQIGILFSKPIFLTWLALLYTSLAIFILEFY